MTFCKVLSQNSSGRTSGTSQALRYKNVCADYSIFVLHKSEISCVRFLLLLEIQPVFLNRPNYSCDFIAHISDYLAKRAILFLNLFLCKDEYTYINIYLNSVKSFTNSGKNNLCLDAGNFVEIVDVVNLE